MNALKTGIDTLGTTAVIAPIVTQEPTINQGIEHIVNTGDIKAPLIALASSVLIQLTLKGFNWLVKKIFPKAV